MSSICANRPRSHLCSQREVESRDNHRSSHHGSSVAPVAAPCPDWLDNRNLGLRSVGGCVCKDARRDRRACASRRPVGAPRPVEERRQGAPTWALESRKEDLGGGNNLLRQNTFLKPSEMELVLCVIRCWDTYAVKAGRWDGSYPLDYYDYESTCGAKNADNELCCILGFSFGLLDFFGFRVQGLRKLVVTLDTMVWVHVWASLSTMCPLDVQFPVCNPFLARKWLRNVLLPVDSD